MRLLHWLWKVCTDKEWRNNWVETCPLVLKTWGGIAMGVGSVAASAISTYGSDGGGGYSYNPVIEHPQYSFTEPRMKLTSDFYTDQIQNLMEGKAPPYLQKYMPGMRESLNKNLEKTYFGRSGERTGAVQQAYERGAITGLGPKGTQAQVDKTMRDYTEKAEDIDRYIDGLLFNATQQAAMKLPYMSQSMPKGPDVSVMGAQQVPEKPNYMGQALGSIASNIPWENMFGGGTTGTTPDYVGGLNNETNAMFDNVYLQGQPESMWNNYNYTEPDYYSSGDVWGLGR